MSTTVCWTAVETERKRAHLTENFISTDSPPQNSVLLIFPNGEEVTYWNYSNEEDRTTLEERSSE